MSLSFSPLAITFVVVELLDVITTVAGITLFSGIVEANRLLPMPSLLWLKFLCVLLGVLILQCYPWQSRKVWLVPAIASLPVVWNFLVISLEWSQFL